MIKTWQLNKTYQTGQQTVRAVQDVSMAVRPGELFGLFGPNGAGKSTLVRLLATLLSPTSGKATVNGFDVMEQPLAVRASIGLVTADERSFYGRLSARRNLRFYAAMQNVPRQQISQRVDHVMELFDLTAKAQAPVQSLSTGQKQRLNMARALIHDPALLFLDEPTKSMDVQTSDFVKQLIKDELVGRLGKTVLFISHELYEMDNFCDRVLILSQGRLQVVGTPQELGEQLPRRAVYRVVVAGATAAVATTWRATPGIELVETVSCGAANCTFDVTLAEESRWQAVMAGVAQENGRLESYRRVDDASLRRIVHHFSGGLLGLNEETGP